jgi:hypothetical protein
MDDKTIEMLSKAQKTSKQKMVEMHHHNMEVEHFEK